MTMVSMGAEAPDDSELVRGASKMRFSDAIGPAIGARASAVAEWRSSSRRVRRTGTACPSEAGGSHPNKRGQSRRLALASGTRSLDWPHGGDLAPAGARVAVGHLDSIRGTSL